MSHNHPQLPTVFVSIEPLYLDIASESNNNNNAPHNSSPFIFSNKRATVVLLCDSCKQDVCTDMYSIYSTTGNLVPGPKDTKYSYLCPKCNGGSHRLRHLPKTWLQVISTALFNMTHRIGVDVIHSMKPSLVIAGSHAHTNTGEGNGGNGWYPFFDIDSEICPFIHHFWDQLTPHNSLAHRGWCSFVLTTAAGHPDLFMSSKRVIDIVTSVFFMEKFSTKSKWGIRYTYSGKLRRDPEVETLKDKRGSAENLQYLVKWRGYSHYAWESIECLDSLCIEHCFPVAPIVGTPTLDKPAIAKNELATNLLQKPNAIQALSGDAVGVDATEATDPATFTESIPITQTKQPNLTKRPRGRPKKRSGIAVTTSAKAKCTKPVSLVIPTRIMAKSPQQSAIRKCRHFPKQHLGVAPVPLAVTSHSGIHHLQPVRMSKRIRMRPTSMLSGQIGVAGTGLFSQRAAVSLGDQPSWYPSEILSGHSISFYAASNEQVSPEQVQSIEQPDDSAQDQQAQSQQQHQHQQQDCSAQYQSSSSQLSSQQPIFPQDHSDSHTPFTLPLPQLDLLEPNKPKPTTKQVEAPDLHEHGITEVPVLPELPEASMPTELLKELSTELIAIPDHSSDLLLDIHKELNLSPSKHLDLAALLHEDLLKNSGLRLGGPGDEIYPLLPEECIPSSFGSLRRSPTRSHSFTPTHSPSHSPSERSGRPNSAESHSKSARTEKRGVRRSPRIASTSPSKTSPPASPPNKRAKLAHSTSPNAIQETNGTSKRKSNSTSDYYNTASGNASDTNSNNHSDYSEGEDLEGQKEASAEILSSSTESLSNFKRKSRSSIKEELEVTNQQKREVSENENEDEDGDEEDEVDEGDESDESDTPSRMPTRLSQKLASQEKIEQDPDYRVTRSSQRLAKTSNNNNSVKDRKKSRTIKTTQNKTGPLSRPAPSSCHQCKSQKSQVVSCVCRKKFCSACLRIHYSESWEAEKSKQDWLCPFCRGICTCKACRVKRDPQEEQAETPRAKSAPPTPPPPPPPPRSLSESDSDAPKYTNKLRTRTTQTPPPLQRKPPPPPPPLISPSPLSSSANTPSPARRKRLTVDAYDLDRFVASSPIPTGLGVTAISGLGEIVNKRMLHTPGWCILGDEDDDGYPTPNPSQVKGNWRSDWQNPEWDTEDTSDREEEEERVKEYPEKPETKGKRSKKKSNIKKVDESEDSEDTSDEAYALRHSTMKDLIKPPLKKPNSPKEVTVQSPSASGSPGSSSVPSSPTSPSHSSDSVGILVFKRATKSRIHQFGALLAKPTKDNTWSGKLWTWLTPP